MKQTRGRLLEVARRHREVFLFITLQVTNKGAPKILDGAHIATYASYRGNTMKIFRVHFIMQHICFFIIPHEEPEARI